MKRLTKGPLEYWLPVTLVKRLNHPSEASPSLMPIDLLLLLDHGTRGFTTQASEFVFDGAANSQTFKPEGR